MNLKKAIMARAEAIERRETASPRLPGGAYNRFFEGYAEYAVPRENGRGERIVRLYADKYYVQRLSVAQKALLRLVYLLLAFGGAFCCWQAASAPLQANRISPAPVFWLAAAFFAIRLLAGLARYLLMKEKLTLPEYKRSSGAVKHFFLGFALSAAAGTAAVVTVSLLKSELTPALHRAAACGGLGALLLLTGFFIERRVPYDTLPNPVEIPRGAIRIHD